MSLWSYKFITDSWQRKCTMLHTIAYCQYVPSHINSYWHKVTHIIHAYKWKCKQKNAEAEKEMLRERMISPTLCADGNAIVNHGSNVAWPHESIRTQLKPQIRLTKVRDGAGFVLVLSVKTIVSIGKLRCKRCEADRTEFEK